MLQEIESALPKLKQTVSRFDLNAEEKVVYEAMIRRLSDARKETYGDLHGIHSSIKLSPEKTMTPAAIAKMIAADELKRRQMGHSVSLSDNAFKTPENGFKLGGFLGAITKGKAMHRIGAGFGKDSTGGWGVTSLEIGMAEKLFAATGLTKRTQRLLYDKFAAELAKEMPYGYAKAANGNLLKALEPDIMDSVIRSAASSTLSDPAGRKVLSVIDREILRKKFANWESKKDTPLTESLKRLIFNMEGREKGGPVNSGQPYIVGEKGPEIFVPRNAGGIIPNGAPMAQGYNAGGFIRMMLMQLLGGFGGQKLGAASGIPGGDMIGMMVGSMLAGGSGMSGGAKVPMALKGRATTPLGATKLVAPLDGAIGPSQKVLTSYGKKLDSLSASKNILAKAAGFAGKAITRLNLGIGAVSLVVGVGINRYKAYQESMRLNALGYGMTAEAASKAGLKFTNFNDKIKEAIEHATALRERNRLLYESMNGSGTPLNITIEQYKKLKKEVKDNYSDQVLLINKTSADDQEALAIRLKEQLIAMGVSAEEAAKKIYAMYAASKFASGAAKYTVGNDEFNNIKDSASAAVSAIKSLNAAMEQGKDPTEQANQLNTAMMALSTDVEARTEALIKKRRAEATKNGDYFSTNDSKQAALDAELAAVTQINSQVKNQVVLTREVKDELAAIDPSIRQIINEQETGLSLWQKTRIQLKGFTGDLRALSASQTNDLYNLQITLGRVIATANSKGVLKKQYEDLERNKRLQAKYEKDARGQKVKDQISDRDKMAALQKQIDLNNKLADSRIKALTAAKEESDLGREIAKKQAEYDAALATGDTAGAQQASLDMEGLQGQLQYNSQVKSIEEGTARLNAPLIKQLEALQRKQQDLADKAAIAGEKLGDLTKVIETQETNIEAVNSAMLDYEIRLLAMAPALREEWKKTTVAKGMIDAIGKAAETAGVKLDGIKTADLGKSIADGIEKNPNAFSRVEVNGNVSIYVGKDKFDIGKLANGTKEDALDSGTVKEAVNAVNQNRSTLDIMKQQAAIKVGAARENQTSIQWNGTWGPYSDRQIVKDYAKMMNYQEGTFFKLKNGDGTYSYFKVSDASGTIMKIDAPAGKAMGGQVNNYDNGGGVKGPGTGTSDSIPAYLSNGEYVIKADSVSKYGVDTFDALNAGKFARGGFAVKNGYPAFSRAGWIEDLLFNAMKSLANRSAKEGKPHVPVLSQTAKTLDQRYDSDFIIGNHYPSAASTDIYNIPRNMRGDRVITGQGRLHHVGDQNILDNVFSSGNPGDNKSGLFGIALFEALRRGTPLTLSGDRSSFAQASANKLLGKQLGDLVQVPKQTGSSIGSGQDALAWGYNQQHIANQQMDAMIKGGQPLGFSALSKDSIAASSQLTRSLLSNKLDKKMLEDLFAQYLDQHPLIKKANGGLIQGYGFGGWVKGAFKKMPQIMGSAAIWQTMEEVETFLSLKYGADKKDSGLEKWSKALGRVAFNTAQGGLSGLTFGGAGGLAGVAAGLVEGLVGLKNGSQYGVKGGKYSGEKGFDPKNSLDNMSLLKSGSKVLANAGLSVPFGVAGNKLSPYVNKLTAKFKSPSIKPVGGTTPKIDVSKLTPEQKSFHISDIDAEAIRSIKELDVSSMSVPDEGITFNPTVAKKGLEYLKTGQSHTGPGSASKPYTALIWEFVQSQREALLKAKYPKLDLSDVKTFNEVYAKEFYGIGKDDAIKLFKGVHGIDTPGASWRTGDERYSTYFSTSPYTAAEYARMIARGWKPGDELPLFSTDVPVSKLESYLGEGAIRNGNAQGSMEFPQLLSGPALAAQTPTPYSLPAQTYGKMFTPDGMIANQWPYNFAGGGTVKIPGYAGGAYVNPTYSPNMSVPSFDSGINSVPVDMLAMIHKNEAVVPASMNPFNPNANNATMGGATYNITNNINGYDGSLEQLSSMVTQKTITAIKGLDSRTASMSGPQMNVSIR